MVLAASKDAFCDLALAKGLLLATRKRVVIFFECHLVVNPPSFVVEIIIAPPNKPCIKYAA